MSKKTRCYFSLVRYFIPFLPWCYQAHNPWLCVLFWNNFSLNVLFGMLPCHLIFLALLYFLTDNSMHSTKRLLMVVVVGQFSVQNLTETSKDYHVQIQIAMKSKSAMFAMGTFNSPNNGTLWQRPLCFTEYRESYAKNARGLEILHGKVAFHWNNMIKSNPRKMLSQKRWFIFNVLFPLYVPIFRKCR